MPRIPEHTNPVEKNATSVQILNAIRNDFGEGTDYYSRVPQATADTQSVREIGNILMSYEPAKNDFLNALVNRIAYVRITSRLYENPLRMFKKGLMELGETVEEVFVNLASPHNFDPETAESEVFKREIPDVRSAFHTMNYQKFYKVTVSQSQLQQAFISWSGVSDLLAKIIESLYTSANTDEFLVTKYLICRVALDGFIFSQTVPDISGTTPEKTIVGIKTVANNFQFMRKDYNHAGVTTYTDPSSLYVLTPSEFSASMDVEVLASAFNMDKAQFIGNRVMIDDFGTVDADRLALLFKGNPDYVPFTPAELSLLHSIQVFMCDVNWFMIFDNLYGMREQENGQGLYWNYWLHVWKTFSASPFANACLFTSQSNAVTGVTITPATATVAKNATATFTANVATTGFAGKGVTWSVSGTKSTISPTGVLSVSGSETANTLTVTAVSNFDNTKKGTATVTVPSA